jgi:antitoxin component HigA of HigAB toxin-antitoxin module
MKIKEALVNEEISYRDFYSALQDKCIGDWDNVNSTDTIRSYITDMMKNGIHISHILEALEQNESEFDDWHIWLGNSMETPEPINSKQDLLNALGISEEDLEEEIEINE